MYSNIKKINKRILRLRKIKKSSNRKYIRLNKDYILKTWDAYSKKYEKELKYLEDK